MEPAPPLISTLAVVAHGGQLVGKYVVGAMQVYFEILALESCSRAPSIGSE